MCDLLPHGFLVVHWCATLGKSCRRCYQGRTGSEILMLWVQRPSLHQLWPVFSSAQKEDKERRADRCVPFCLPKNCRIKGWVISLTLLMSCTPMARREEQQLSCTTREVLLRGDSTQQTSFGGWHSSTIWLGLTLGKCVPGIRKSSCPRPCKAGVSHCWLPSGGPGGTYFCPTVPCWAALQIINGFSED